jgi:hypothetical protein
MASQSNSLEWEECRMKALCTATPAAWLRRLTLALLTLLGFASHAAATVQCSDYQPYTLKIFNDTTDYNIYPVIATPTNDADEWLQGAAQILDSQKTTLTYGHKFVYRIYINPTAGIAPHGSVTVTLPLCSQLADKPDPTQPDQYINWWNRGRVYIYDNLFSAGKPPPELTADFTKDQANPVSVNPWPLLRRMLGGTKPADLEKCGTLQRPHAKAGRATRQRPRAIDGIYLNWFRQRR